MRSLLFLFLVLLIAGCSSPDKGHDRGLDEAEALIPSAPAEAMERLNRYDVAEFGDSATMARWALLYSEAMVANRITAPTDTIINIAIDYYGRENRPAELEQAVRLKTMIASGERDELASALYIQKEKEFMLYKARERQRQYLLGGLFLLIVTLSVISVQRYKLKLKDAQNEALIAEASGLRDGLTHHRSECSALHSKLADVLSNRFRIIDELCGTYYESQGTKTERKAIAEAVKLRIEELKSDDGIFGEMEKCVNDCRDGLLRQLKEQWPEIKPEDYRMMIYLACNLSNRTIALLIGENMNVVYKRKSRLKARIQHAGFPSTSLFMSVF